MECKDERLQRARLNNCTDSRHLQGTVLYQSREDGPAEDVGITGLFHYEGLIHFQHVCVWDCPLLEEICSTHLFLPVRPPQPCTACADGESEVCVQVPVRGRVCRRLKEK